MIGRHKKQELLFYNKAFKNNSLRRDKKYGWEFNPSRSVIELVEKNELSRNAKGKRVLDLGCGDGRHIEYFRKLGFEVWGVDFSKEAISLCKKRFAGDKKVHLVLADLTEKNILSQFGNFDIIIDWSVLDHIRKQYLKKYLKNIFGSLAVGGYGIFSEFNESLSGLFKGKRFKVSNGHYSCAYTKAQLLNVLSPLKLIDQKINVSEDNVNNYRFNVFLLKK